MSRSRSRPRTPGARRPPRSRRSTPRRGARTPSSSPATPSSRSTAASTASLPDDAQARAFLGDLQGRTHDVLGAVAIATPAGDVLERTDRTLVTFAPLTAGQIAAYAATGEWEGRAGGYAIQGRGAALVEAIDIYRQLVCLREYVLIDPTQYLIEVFLLNEHRRWELNSFEGADSIVELTSIRLRCALTDFYEDVVFGSM